MKIKERVVNAMREFLRIDEANPVSVTIKEQMDFKTNAFKNRLWYRGKSYELNQFYRTMENFNHSFWGSIPTEGLEIRKMHSGLPKIIIDTITNIIIAGFDGFDFEENEEAANFWQDIEKDNNFIKTLKRAIRETCYIGDGAFKISFDSDVTEYPIIEWVSGYRMRKIEKRGRLHEIVFETEYKYPNNRKYILEEYYGYGYVNYKLFLDGKEISIDSIEETRGLQDVTFDKKLMLAVPLMFAESDEYTGRGQSMFDGKCDSFDSFDEAISQWQQAMRESRPTKYINKALLKIDEDSGQIQRPNPFDNQFIELDDDVSEDGKNGVTLIQPTFPTTDYLNTYVTIYNQCLQGLISPSTLGIDNKKLDNAEAQREKEKTTLYTRANIIDALVDVLPKLVHTVFNAYNVIVSNKITDDVVVTVNFGEYASPSFEALLETLSKGAPGAQIISFEAIVDEEWGDTKDEEWKEKEVERLKELAGIATVDELSIADDLEEV